MVFWKTNFVAIGFTRIDDEGRVVGRALSTDMGSMEVEVCGIRPGKLIHNGISSCLLLQLIVEVHDETRSALDANGRSREAAAEHSGLENVRSNSGVSPSLDGKIDLDVGPGRELAASRGQHVGLLEGTIGDYGGH